MKTAVLLNDTLQLDLTPGQLAALETRTEVWIAGLHMAANAMQSIRSNSQVEQSVKPRS